MGKPISLKMRWIIVTLHRHWLGPKLPLKSICKKLHVSLTSAKNWVKVYDETGEVEEIALSGRPKITGPKEDQLIKSLSLSNPEASAQEISNQLKSMGTVASATTVRRRLASYGMVYNRPISKPLLTKKHRSERVAFARRNKSTNWNSVLFTDKSTFQLSANPEKMWMRRRKKLFVRRVKHPQKIHAWGSFSNSGFGDLVLFTGTLNAIKLIDIYNTALLPSSNFLFDENWTLQEDNDPKHTSKLAKKLERKEFN